MTKIKIHAMCPCCPCGEEVSEKEELENQIELRLRYAFPCYSAEADGPDYFYMVREKDLQRAVKSIADMFSSTL